MANAAIRIPNAQRSAATRARLLDATIEALVELGWEGTSTTEVVRRAGVSRGALVHHFPTKDDLVLEAIESLYERRSEEYRQAFEQLPADQRTIGPALELLWAECFGPTFDAFIELEVAVRRSPELHERYVSLHSRFEASTIDRFQELLPDEFADRTVAATAMRLTFALLDGLALSRRVGSPKSELDSARHTFALMAESFLTTLKGEAS